MHIQDQAIVLTELSIADQMQTSFFYYLRYTDYFKI